MTLNELKAEVCALGFERAIELDSSFVSSVNRSLAQIFTERNVISNMKVECRKAKYQLYVNKYLHSGSESKEFCGSAKAFIFRSFGTGKMTLTDDFGIREYEFSGNGTVTKGFVFGEANLVFKGEFCYSIYDLTLFSEIFSDNPKDIKLPFDNYEFDGKEYDNRFISFSSFPTGNNGELLYDVTATSKHLTVPYHYEGIVNISYKRSCETLTLNDGEKEIDLPVECEHLLPLLTASYVWLDDDAGKSQYYYNMYREGMTATKFYSRESQGQKILTNGWA